MTKEQAIEVLEKIDVKFFISGMTEQKDYIIDKADKVNVAIETVLSMLEEKDIKLIETKEANRQLSIELKNKDKIIDLMSEQLAGLTIFDINNDELLILGNKKRCKTIF